MVTEQDFPQIARELGVTTSEVAEMNIRLSGADISLNSYINSEDSTTELLEFLPETRPTQEVSLINQEELRRKRKVLTQAMTILNERELQILTERKLQDSPTTLDDLSIKYKISKERVRQIENKAFEKIQNFVLNQVAC
jgi:RNA polymerase sigma-32 factor